SGSIAHLLLHSSLRHGIEPFGSSGIRRLTPRIYHQEYGPEWLSCRYAHPRLAAQLADIRTRRRAKHPSVLAAEMRRAFIANAIACGRRLETFPEHESSRFMQTQLLLELERRHARDLLEDVVERRLTHVHVLGEIARPQRFGKAILEY